MKIHIQTNLNRHIQSNEGQRNYICDSSISSTFKEHRKIVHEGLKDHKCIYCGKTFIGVQNLNEHIVFGCDMMVQDDQNDDTIENNSDFQVIVDVKMIENEIEEDNFFNCNCRELDKLISTHFCEQCAEGFCQDCVELHQRYKGTQLHNLQLINYYCKCHNDEKIWASKYCQECLEALCIDCVIAHERSIETKNHILKSI